MFGKGSMDDARALQESFRRPKSPHRNNRGRGRGGGRGSGNSPQRGNFHGNERQDLSPPARGSQSRQGLPNAYTPTQRAHPAPIAASFQSISSREKRIASSEQNHDPKRVKGSSPEGPNQANYLPRGQVSSQPFNSGIFAPRARRDGDDLMDFEQPASLSGPHMRQQNLPIQPVPRNTIDSSILDTRGEEINQPVMHFTARSEAQESRQEDVTMGGIKKSDSKGLDASRWNLEDTQFTSLYGGEQRSVEGPLTERRGPAPSSGRLVSSGISKGPGLADSRWAS
ncbi:hypothetical protein F4776DRAFT_627409 [Hypoxylon sp. NC0597]|nr:hypothetical protein F4776DRAFT_627409 [Hypoxylon sp. NC0597]